MPNQRREGKYRAWHKPRKVWIEWEGLSAMMDGKQISVFPSLGFSLGNARDLNKLPTSTVLRGNPFTHPDLILSEWTGELDVRGREIYEGHFVRYKRLDGFGCYEENWREHKDIKWSGPQEVRFSNGEFSPREEAHIVEDGFYSWRVFDLEIVDNYSTPELLK